MTVPNRPEKAVTNLLHGIFLILFGTFSLVVALVLTRAIDNWFILFIIVASFVVPALGAFWLGVKRLGDFAKSGKTS